MRTIYYFLSIFILIGFSCQDKDHRGDSEITLVQPDYATGFYCHEVDSNVKVVTVKQPYQNAENSIRYLLVKKGTPIPEGYEGHTIIRTPVKRLVCTSTTHIPLLDYLGSMETLVGFPSTDLISAASARERVEAGLVADLGRDMDLDHELLLTLEPEMVMAYTISGNMGPFKKIQEAGIPVVINAEYLEQHPLGRAEWLKFMGYFLEKDSLANKVFNEIKDRYHALQSLIEDTGPSPTVMTGVMYGDAWFLPSGENYGAILLKDAGLVYLWEDTQGKGSMQLSFEKIYEKALDADLWIGAADFTTYEAMAKADRRYTLFRPFKDQKVYSFGEAWGPTGGNIYLESGYLRPDLILSDLIKIAYPSLLEDEEFHFYAPLRP